MPDGWVDAVLGDVADITIGRTPPRDDPRYWTTDLTRPFCTIADMDAGVIVPRREGVTAAAETDGRAKRMSAGSLLLSFKLTIGRVGIAGVDLFPNEAIARIEPRTASLNKRFLALWLSATDLTLGAGRAVKGNTLNSTSLRAIPVSYPSLAEQRRIVDLIRSVESAFNASGLVTRHATRAWMSLALASWTDTEDTVELGSLGEAITGSTPRTARPEFWAPANVPFFTPSDFGEWPLVTAAGRAISREGAASVRVVKAPAVAQVCIGSLGKVGVLLVDGCTNQQINSLVGLDETDAIALAALLATSAAQARLRSIAGQTTLPIVNKGAWRRMEVRWPSRQYREALAGLVWAAILVAQRADAQARALARLRAALLADLLSGDHEMPCTYDRFLDGAA